MTDKKVANQPSMSKNTEITTPSENDENVDFALEQNITICQNCEKEHNTEFKFCPHCGQQTNDELTVGVLFYNTIANYFSFDARFFRSFIPLVFKPGILAKRFVSGKRLMYLHPAQMYLFISVVFFFLFSFKIREYNANFDKALEKGFEMEKSKDSININPIDSSAIAKMRKPLEGKNLVPGLSEQEQKEFDSILTAASNPKNLKNNFNFGYDTAKLDSLIAIDAPEKEQLKAVGMKDDAGFFKKQFFRQLIKFHKNKGGGIVQALFDSVPISLFFLLPIFALLLKIFYWRRGRFAHHLVFSFYYFSFLFTVMCIIFGINYIVEIPDWIDFLVLLSTFFYLVFALRNYYEQGFFISLIKSSMLTFIYMMVVAPMTVMIVLILGFLFY
ncbi:DUF3667 domain-containing protein [Pontimicrobium sp. SW4]|uniref:DUF3667 domain-containing protein n=1 Tax=Pontimicrobium sp. SW4 TaxID=3153519 RepID=A0AAU7BW87_9FLAO